MERSISSNIAKAGRLQRQGIKGEDVNLYFEPLITPHLKVLPLSHRGKNEI